LVLRFLRGLDPSGFELTEIEKISGTPAVIIEAGAFNGVDTLKMSKFWPEAKVFAFEPIPELYDEAKLLTSGHNQIELFPFALVNSDRRRVKINTFYEMENKHGSSSILEPALHLKVAPQVKFDRVMSVPACRLDDWYSGMNGMTVDLLWLDLQGAELEVLKSGLNCLKNTRTLHVEVSLESLYDGAPTFEELHAFLLAKEFHLVEVRIPVLSGNAIYIQDI